MKKFIKEHSTLAIVIISVLLILLVILGVILATRQKNSHKVMGNDYLIQEKEVEFPGTKVVSTDGLKEEKCLNNICVSNITVYSNDSRGRIECTITNKTQEKKSGYLKVLFDNQTLIVAYNNLLPEGSTKAVAQFEGYSLKDANNYSLDSLSKEELEKIVSK